MDNQHLFSKLVSLEYGDEFVLNTDGSVEGAKLYTEKQGGYVIFYSRKTPTYWYKLHREIYKAFVREIPTGYYINHIDGDKQNNKVSNLELVNSSYSSCHMRYILGKSCGNGKGSLTPSKLYEIVIDIQSGTYDHSWEVADRHGVHNNLILAINNGKKYKFYTENIMNLSLPINNSTTFTNRRPRRK